MITREVDNVRYKDVHSIISLISLMAFVHILMEANKYVILKLLDISQLIKILVS
jgi:hypothetical protein